MICIGYQPILTIVFIRKPTNWPGMADRITSWCLDMEVAVSIPPTADQLPQLAPLYWPWTLSWKIIYIFISLIKKV